LAGFAGTLLFVSHDRYFINKVATRVAAFDEGRLLLYDGGYDDYLAALRGGGPGRVPRRAEGIAVLPSGDRPVVPDAAGARRERAGGSGTAAKRRDTVEGARPAHAAGGREQRRHEAEARNRRGKELRAFRDRIASLEAAILPLET